MHTTLVDSTTNTLGLEVRCTTDEELRAYRLGECVGKQRVTRGRRPGKVEIDDAHREHAPAIRTALSAGLRALRDGQGL